MMRVALYRAGVIGMALVGPMACQPARAELAVTGSRFVYQQEDTRLSIPVRNVGDAPILVQSWLDEGDDVGPESAAVPFFLTPPVLRLEPDRPERLELRWSGEALPTDRESLFWINLLEVPSSRSDTTNLLRLSYRLRMKLLYRPTALSGSSREAVLQVRWTATPETGTHTTSLQVENVSAYYVSYSAVALHAGEQVVDLGQMTLAPRSVQTRDVPRVMDLADDQLHVRYEAVVDAGKYLVGRADVVPATAGVKHRSENEMGDSKQ